MHRSLDLRPTSWLNRMAPRKFTTPSQLQHTYFTRRAPSRDNECADLFPLPSVASPSSRDLRGFEALACTFHGNGYTTAMFQTSECPRSSSYLGTSGLVVSRLRFWIQAAASVACVVESLHIIEMAA